MIVTWVYFELLSFAYSQQLMHLYWAKQPLPTGGAVAEWSKALQLWEKINENQKDPRVAPPT